jgi:hypothetical protein
LRRPLKAAALLVGFFVRLVGLAPPIQREFPRAKSNLFD